MTRPVCLQVYISTELNSAIRAAARARGVSVSEWVRTLIVDATCEDDLATRFGTTIERMSRQSVFLMVGIDALLLGHPDHALRERAHKAFARKCRELGLAPAAGEGDDA